MKYSWLYRTRTRALLGIMLAPSLAACGNGHSPTASEGADAQDLSLVEDSGARNGGDAPAIAPGEPNPGVPVASVEALVTALSETGINATYQGQSLGTSWFLPAEHLVNINGQDVRIFAYDSVQALEEDADKVSLDGGTIGLVSVRWMAPPPDVVTSNPGLDDAALIVVGSAAGLERLVAYLPEKQVNDDLLSTDLTQNWIVAIFRGTMPTAGYGLDAPSGPGETTFRKTREVILFHGVLLASGCKGGPESTHLSGGDAVLVVDNLPQSHGADLVLRTAREFVNGVTDEQVGARFGEVEGHEDRALVACPGDFGAYGDFAAATLYLDHVTTPDAQLLGVPRMDSQGFLLALVEFGQIGAPRHGADVVVEQLATGGQHPWIVLVG